MLEVPWLLVAAAELELEIVPRDRDRPPEAEETPRQPDVDVDLERRLQGSQDAEDKRNRSLGRRPEEALREDDVGSPRRVAGLPSRVLPKRPFLSNQEAVASMTALLLVVEDAREGRSEEPLHLLAKLRQPTSRSRRRQDPDDGAEMGKVVV